MSKRIEALVAIFENVDKAALEVDYAELGIIEEDIPYLIEILKKGDTFDARIDASRALGQLKAVEALDHILFFYDKMSDEMSDEMNIYDDILLDDILDILLEIGPPSLNVIFKVFDDIPNLKERILETVERIGVEYPETRKESIAFLINQLKKAEYNSPKINAFIICSLYELKAVEAYPLIEKCYKKNLVDLEFITLQEVKENLFFPKLKAKRMQEMADFAEKFMKNL